MEISVYRLVPVEDPNEEPLHWLQCEQLWETEYARHAAGEHYDKRHIDRTLARMVAASAHGGGATGRLGGGAYAPEQDRSRARHSALARLGQAARGCVRAW